MSVRFVALVFLTGCQLLFKLEDVSDGPPPDLRPQACKHEGLILCLPFDEVNADRVSPDFSERHLDATVNQATIGEREPGEPALDVTPASEVFVLGNAQFPTDTMFDLQAPFSFDLWLLSRADNKVEVVLDNPFQFAVRLQADGRIECLIRFEPNAEFAPSLVVARRTWHHVACVLDASGVHTYIDGVAVPPQGDGLATVVTSGTTALQIGRTLNDPSAGFDGMVDNVRIWNRALDGNEVLALSLGNED